MQLILEDAIMKNEIISNLILDVKKIIEDSKKQVVRNVNTIMLHAYWNIDKRIVEEEQNGNKTATYGDYIIKNLSMEIIL